MAGDDYCYLTTTGRRTGKAHEIEIWYATAGDTVYLLAGGGRRSDWVANLVALPACTVRIGATSRPGAGRLLDEPGADAEEEGRARRLVFEKYEPRDDRSLAEWRERSTPVAIDLTGEA